jgi:hypothetical protein
VIHEYIMDEDDRSSRSDKQKMHRMVVEIILPQSGFVQRPASPGGKGGRNETPENSTQLSRPPFALRCKPVLGI